MKKIELYQLSFYLLFEIEFLYNNQRIKLKNLHFFYNADENGEIVGRVDCTRFSTENTVDNQYAISAIKPILKPISDIPQGEINELFEMFGDLCRIGNQLHFNEFLREHFENLDTLPLRICQELAKRGYDIFNLLKNNLAINFYSC